MRTFSSFPKAWKTTQNGDYSRNPAIRENGLFSFIFKLEKGKNQRKEEETRMIKRAKHKDNFLVLDKSFFDDPRLNTTQRGLLATMLTYPDKWIFHLKPLQEKAHMGHDALETNLKALERAGYLIRGVKKRDSSGKFIGSDLIVHETSTLPLTGKTDTDYTDMEDPETENQNTGPPFTDKQTVLNNNESIINKTKNNISNNHTVNIKYREPASKEAYERELPKTREEVLEEYRKMKDRGEEDMKLVELMLLATN